MWSSVGKWNSRVYNETIRVISCIFHPGNYYILLKQLKGSAEPPVGVEICCSIGWCWKTLLQHNLLFLRRSSGVWKPWKEFTKSLLKGFQLRIFFVDQKLDCLFQYQGEIRMLIKSNSLGHMKTLELWVLANSLGILSFSISQKISGD